MLGALLGLFGQQGALAAGPTWHSVAALVETGNRASIPADSDCMQAMAEKSADRPCKGLTLDCIAAMGCTVPMTLAIALIVPVMGSLPWEARVERAVRSLAGRKLLPEMEPPAA